MKFCSECGSDQIKKEIPKGDNRLRSVCGNCGTIHYRNPKVITGCLPIWRDKVLLCRRAIEPRKGYWNVPAGFMELGESAEEGAAREVWEEAEARVEIESALTIFTFTKFSHVYIQFVGKLIDGKYGIGEESTEVQLFAEEEIPWSEMAFESSTFALKKYFEDRKNGMQQTHLGSF